MTSYSGTESELNRLGPPMGIFQDIKYDVIMVCCMCPLSVCPQPFGVLSIQLAHYHGVKVLATAHSPDDQKFLEQLRPSVGEEGYTTQ